MRKESNFNDELSNSMFTVFSIWFQTERTNVKRDVTQYVFKRLFCLYLKTDSEETTRNDGKMLNIG